MPVSASDPRIQRCAFAKLHGVAGFPAPGYHLVKKYEITLGRRSKSSSLDVVLGENMNISRKHAKISYNFDKGAFELSVLGKNGVTVGGVLYTPTSPPLILKSRDLLQIGESSFYFLLPSLPSQETQRPVMSLGGKKRVHPAGRADPAPSKKRQGSSQRKPHRKSAPTAEDGGGADRYPQVQGSDEDADQQEDVLYQSRNQYLQEDDFQPHPAGERYGGGYEQEEDAGNGMDDDEDVNPRGGNYDDYGGLHGEYDNAAPEEEDNDDGHQYQAGGYDYDDDDEEEEEDNPQYSE